MSRHVVRRHLGRSIVASAVAWAVSQANAQTIDFNGLAIPAGLDRTAIPVTYQPIDGLTINFGGVGIYNGGPGLGGGAGNNNAYTFGTADTCQSYLFSRPVRIDSLALTGFGGSDLRPLTVHAYSSAIASPETLLGSFAITPKPHASGTYPTNAWTTFTGAAALGANVRSLVVSGLTDDPQVDNIAVTVGAPNPTPVTPAVRVMPLGDSITHGSSRPNDPIGFPGYRYALAGNFQRAGTNADYVGSNRYMPNGKQPYNFFYPASSTTNDVFFDQDHEGHSGYTTADLISKPADGFSLATALQGNVPDVVMLHAGTNDVGKNLSIGSAVTNIKTIIDTLRLANPNVKVALAKITPITPSSSGYGQYAANVATFNNALGTAAAGWGTAASPMLVVDQNKGYDPTAMHFDGLHPNSRGEQLIADRFFVAYHKLTNPGGPLVSPAPHIGNGTFDELEVSSDSDFNDNGDGEYASLTNPGASGRVGNGWTWRGGNGSNAGVWNPASTDYRNAAGKGTPIGASGPQVAFLFNDTALASDAHRPAAEQPMGAILLPDTDYTMSVAIGTRLPTSTTPGNATYGGYTIELYAGDTLIATETNAVTPTVGEFVDAAVTINSRLLDPNLLGSELRVRVLMPNNSLRASVEFDDVRVAAFTRASEWGGDSNATWDTAGAWIGTTPPTSGARVTFGPTITADRVIAFGTAKSLAAIGFDNANRYWLRGTSALTLASPDGVANVHDFRGSHTIGTPVVLGTSARTTVYEAGDVLTLAATVSSDPALTLFKAGMGTLELNTIDVGGLAVDRGRVRFLRFGTGSGVSATSRVRSLTLGGGGGNAPIVTLDLSDRTLVLDYSSAEGSPLAQVQNWIASGAATGRGILSSAPLVADGSAAVGFAEANAIGLAGTTYRGIALDATSLVIAYAYRGDTDLNGIVNFDDLLRLATHFGGTAGKTWSNGDADHDGNVDFDDLLAMAKNYNRTLGTATAASSFDLFEADFALARALVPEPTALFAIGLGGAVIGRRSRSRGDAVQRRA